VNRAGHYAESERLLTDALARIEAAAKHATQVQQARNDAHLLLRASLIHASLAGVDSDVELEAAVASERPKPGPPNVAWRARS
jgi:hypothetical protein